MGGVEPVDAPGRPRRAPPPPGGGGGRQRAEPAGPQREQAALAAGLRVQQVDHRQGGQAEQHRERARPPRPCAIPSAGKSSTTVGSRMTTPTAAAARHRHHRPRAGLPGTQRDQPAERAGQRRHCGRGTPRRAPPRRAAPRAAASQASPPTASAAGPTRRRVSAYQANRMAAASATTASRYQTGRYGSSSSAYPGRIAVIAAQSSWAATGATTIGTRASPKPAASRPVLARPAPAGQPAERADRGHREQGQRQGQPAGVADQPAGHREVGGVVPGAQRRSGRCRPNSRARPSALSPCCWRLPRSIAAGVSSGVW